MPAAIALSRCRIADVVLLAQLAGDSFGRRVQVARLSDDFSPAAAVIGEVAQRDRVDAIMRSRWSGPRRPCNLRTAAGPPWRTRKWNRHRRHPRRWTGRPWRKDGSALAVDPDGVDHDLTLAYQLLQIDERRVAGRVVAVGNQHDRLLLMAAG